MKKEPFEKKDGYRVWLSEQEQEQLIQYYEEEPKKQIAIKLLLSGLRSDEIPQITLEDFRKMDTEQEGWMLTIREGKTGFRETPVSNSLASDARTIKNFGEINNIFSDKKENKKAKVTKVVKDGSESGTLLKKGRGFVGCFAEKLPTDCFGYPTDRPYFI